MLIADTGFWIALANRKDRFHQAALRAIDSYQERLVTTWPVITETCHLLAARLGPRHQTSFLAGLAREGAQLLALTEPHLVRIVELMERYEDVAIDLADASLIVAAEELNEGRILSSDRRDFAIYRWNDSNTFSNVLLDQDDLPP